MLTPSRRQALIKALREHMGRSLEQRYAILRQLGFSEEELQAVPTLDAAMRGELDDSGPGGRGPIPVPDAHAKPIPKGPSVMEWILFGLLILVILRCAAG